MSTSVETLEFQAEARQLLHLVVHSIYSNKDIFLRELISNASDALGRMLFESMINKDLDVDTSDLHIALEIDDEARTLTVRDNGIGMTRDEVIQVIGTIAKSGTAELGRQVQVDGVAVYGHRQVDVALVGVGRVRHRLWADQRGLDDRRVHCDLLGTSIAE